MVPWKTTAEEVLYNGTHCRIPLADSKLHVCINNSGIWSERVKQSRALLLFPTSVICKVQLKLNFSCQLKRRF